MRRLVVFVILASLVGPSTVIASNSRFVTSPIDGRWEWTWTRADLTRNHETPFNVKTLAGPEVAVFANGHYRGHNLRTGRIDAGRFSVKGYVVTFTPEIGPSVGGGTATMTFSIYRDRLTWKLAPGRRGWSALTITPWTRSS